MKIEDNFLTKHEFDRIKNLVMSFDFPWFFNKIIDYDDETHNYFQFTHLFYSQGLVRSKFFDEFTPVINRLKLFSLLRMKLNLLTRTENMVINQFHVDESQLTKNQLKNWTTSILYINNNNGYTEFEDGTKIESVANRLVTFPANIKHRGTSCTDEKTRIVLNLNYYK